MAQRILVILIDDIDGNPDEVSTVQFMLDGTDYEIDLKPEHAAQLRATLQPFTERAPSRHEARQAPERHAEPRT
jgi:hypothetical protein